MPRQLLRVVANVAASSFPASFLGVPSLLSFGAMVLPDRLAVISGGSVDVPSRQLVQRAVLATWFIRSDLSGKTGGKRNRGFYKKQPFSEPAERN